MQALANFDSVTYSIIDILVLRPFQFQNWKTKHTAVTNITNTRRMV